MDTKQLNRILACTVYGVVITALVFSVTGGVYAQDEPSPFLRAFPEGNAVDGGDWPLGVNVHMAIDDPATENDPDYEDNATVVTSDEGWIATYVRFDFDETYDLKSGDEVTLSAGEILRYLVVPDLQVTRIDPDANVVAGTIEPYNTVEPYTLVHVFIGEEAQLYVNASSEGAWVAEFNKIGFDLQPGMSGNAEVWFDEYNDSTIFNWTNSRFTVFPEREFFDGLDWPDGAIVLITVAGKPECATSKESWDYFFNGNFGEGCDIEFGDEVTFTDGETVRTHTVQNLVITKTNQEDDIVKGTAEAGAEVHVWPHATGEELLATANPKDKWNVDFTGIYDLATGDGGRAEIRDDMGNATAVDWYIPQPRFVIFPDAQWFDGNDWPDGATVTITVKNKPECTFTQESWGGFFNGGFPEDCFVTAGDRVTFTDGNATRKHTVRNLAITMIDKEANTATGIADTGAVVHTWVWNSDGSTLDGSNLEVTAVDGMWQADFGAFDINLEIGMGIQAEIRDENGNATSVDLNVPNTRIVASITEDWFFLADFLPGAPLDIALYSQDGELIWPTDGQEITANVNGFAWIDSEGWDLEPGNYLVVSDGNTTKDLVIEGFTFDVFDLANGHLEGTAPEPFGSRTVWVGIGFENDVWSMEVTTDGTGAWYADFDTPVPSNYQWVAAQIFDEDGDASELRPSSRMLTMGNFYVAWSQTNPEEVIYLSWKGSDNLTNSTGVLEFFGNSWVSEDENTPEFFFASLVGWCTTGTWTGTNSEVSINSISSGCPGSADIPIHTNYQFFSDEQHANLIMVERTFEFEENPYAHDVRPFIPRLYPSNGFTQVLHPDESSTTLVIDGTCDFGCVAESWDGSWFAIHNPDTSVGMVVQSLSNSIALWLDDDDGSFTNSSSILLLKPEGGFTGMVAETEYLCFYDDSWEPSLTLPEGCLP